MNILPMLGCGLVSLTALGGSVEEFFDQVDDALTVSAYNDQLRARLSGLVDLEGYVFQRPTPGLLDTGGDRLFNPRLTLFLDNQLGPHLYAFVQARLDRGFDPGDGPAQARVDEYAIRFTPGHDGRFNIQGGKFASVVGNWNSRHRSWDNPFINAPLPYENVTTIFDREVPARASDFFHGLNEPNYEYNPIVWGPSYATGVSAAGQIGRFDYATELKNASLSSRPESWSFSEVGFSHPTLSGRTGFRPSPMWSLGISGSAGSYLRQEAGPLLPVGRSIGDYRELLVGQDIRFEWHHLQLWAEVYEARFEVPRVGDADCVAYYVETKYKFTPRCFSAIRWNQQLFGTVPDGLGGRIPWDRDLWRIDLALGLRFTPHTQLKLQYSFQQETIDPRRSGNSVAAQFTLRF